MSRATTWVTTAAQLGRASVLGVTWAFVLLGMASAGRAVDAAGLVVALGAATAFHVAAYAGNDLVDLPVDRTDPRRAASPLVRGTVSPRAAAGAVAVAAAVALGTAALAGPVAAAAMGAALVLLGAYDLWGKRTRVPPVTDLVQGLGWAALACFGAAAAGGLTAGTGWLAAYVTVMIALVNGVVGAVRDLANDGRHGVRTTALVLGAHVRDDGRHVLPTRFWAYAVVLHVASVATVLGGLVATGTASSAHVVATVVAGGLGLALLLAGLAAADRPTTSWRAGFGHIVVVLMLPAVLVLDHLDGLLLGLLVVLFAAPWAGSRWVRATVRSLVRRTPQGALP